MPSLFLIQRYQASTEGQFLVGQACHRSANNICNDHIIFFVEEFSGSKFVFEELSFTGYSIYRSYGTDVFKCNNCQSTLPVKDPKA